MKMFRLGQETMNVCQRNVARFVKHDVKHRLSAYGGVGIEVSYFCCKNIKISTKMSQPFSPYITPPYAKPRFT